MPQYIHGRHKKSLVLVKIFFRNKENVSKFKFFTVPAYRISCFKNMQPEHKRGMKHIMGINFVLN